MRCPEGVGNSSTATYFRNTQGTSSLTQNLQDREKQHQEALTLVEARIYDLDIYKQLEERLKHDILIMRKRNFDKDGALKK